MSVFARSVIVGKRSVLAVRFLEGGKRWNWEGRRRRIIVST